MEGVPRRYVQQAVIGKRHDRIKYETVEEEEEQCLDFYRIFLTIAVTSEFYLNNECGFGDRRLRVRRPSAAGWLRLEWELRLRHYADSLVREVVDGAAEVDLKRNG